MTTRETRRAGRGRADDEDLEALLCAATGGDARAMEELLAALRPRLQRMAAWEVLRRGLHLDAAQLDDVVQEALVETWRTDLPRFDAERGHLLPFLRRRVRWTVLEQVRARVRQRVHSLDDEMERGHDPEAVGARPDERLADTARERALLAFPRAVARAAAELDDEAARRAILRHDVQGAPLRRVARELGVHPSNATRARQRGLQRLRGRLEEAWSEVLQDERAHGA